MVTHKVQLRQDENEGRKCMLHTKEIKKRKTRSLTC